MTKSQARQRRRITALIVGVLAMMCTFEVGRASVLHTQWTEHICAWVTPVEDFSVPNHEPGYTCWDELHNR
jgi:hypothetical protein